MSTTVRYRLACPTRASTIASLTRVFSQADADTLWRQAAAGIVDPDVEDVSVTDVRAVCDRLATRPGLVGVLASSLRVRCDTYIALEHVG